MTLLFILWNEPDTKRFAEREEAIAAATMTAGTSRLFSFDPKSSEWHLLIAKGTPVRGEPWVNGTELPLRLWLMGTEHRRSGR